MTLAIDAITYHFAGRHYELSEKDILKALKIGRVVNSMKISHRISPFGAGAENTPIITEYIWELEVGLMVTFRPDTGGIQENVEYALDRQNFRQILAFEASHVLGLSICPASSLRISQTLGPGSCTARFRCTPYSVTKYMEDRITDQGRPLYLETSLVEAIVFDYIIGSGHRKESSYMIDEKGRVRSCHHYEAFSFIAEDELIGAFARTNQTVSVQFMRMLRMQYERSFKILLFSKKVIHELGDETWHMVAANLRSVILERKLGPHQIFVADSGSAQPVVVV
ncbi:MAG: hypothetical protein P1P90_00325 [Patescibacteria group bacterium]|nr:hypothetical protein [Patescibacteria group bacterium]